MIEVQHLTKYYGQLPAVQDLSFYAPAGSIVGLLGPNGAGKTTTIRLLTGYMPPTSGRIRIAGYDVQTAAFAARTQIGYLPERVPLYPDMTAEEYVLHWARLRGVPHAKQQTAHILRQLQLDDRRRTLVRQLSKGMRQRLGLAQALVHQPAVVILDEPTIGIDPQQVIEVREQIRALAQQHTVLFSTHILSEAEQICDRIIILHRGRMLAEGHPATLRDQLQGGQQLYVELAPHDATQALAVLHNLPHVVRAQAQAPGYRIQVQSGIDLRATIAEALHNNGLRLVELRPLVLTLEDIFLDVVHQAELP